VKEQRAGNLYATGCMRALLVEGHKMSKSLGNFYTLRDLLAQGYSPLAIRYLLVSAPYRKQLNFTLEGLRGSETRVKKLKISPQTP